MDVLHFTSAATSATAIAVAERDGTETSAAITAKGYVVTGDFVVDVSGTTAAADLAEILAALDVTDAGTALQAAAVFKADTNGDGSANEVQVWQLTDGTGTGTAADIAAVQLGVLTGYSTSADLAGDFVGDGTTSAFVLI